MRSKWKSDRPQRANKLIKMYEYYLLSRLQNRNTRQKLFSFVLKFSFLLALTFIAKMADGKDVNFVDAFISV